MIPALVLASLSVLAPVPDELLPATPDGWRYEKLDFPLSFAPEIEWEGFEELRFAPGMFEEGADDFWSYVLAIRVDRDVALGEPELEDFLERYYRGLCVAVGEGRDLEVDPDAIVADVAFDGRDFVATIDIVDAFVTGEPLELRLELSVHPGPTSTELLGLASPAPEGAEVWSELRAIREAWRAERPAPVVLNHVYFVPDRPTYDALVASKLLRGMAPSETRETVRADLSYSGLYVYGASTYFEFLEPTKGANLLPGSSGIALGVEASGGNAALAETLKAGGTTTFAAPISRAIDGEQVPWFSILGVQQPHTECRMQLFSMEYDPAFLRSWHGDRGPRREESRARRDVLERYAAHLDQVDLRDGGLLRDVTAVHLELNEAELEWWLDLCRAFGWVVREDGERWLCDAPGASFHVARSEVPGGVTAIELSLREATEREPVRLGAATLTFRGETALLELARP